LKGRTKKTLEILAIDLDRTLEDLLKESVADLVEKYQKRKKRKDIEI